MKQLLPFFLFPLVLFACIDSQPGADGSASKKTAIVTTRTWQLDQEASSVNWKRFLHQGPTKTTMRLFGAETTVDLGELTFNTEGEIKPISGTLTEVDGELQSGSLTFDISNLKINTDRQQQGDDIFKVDQFPESTFEILSFRADSVDHILTVKLTIANVSKTFEVPAHINTTVGGQPHLTSQFTIQTLDWPFRDEEAKKIVIKDELTINMDLRMKDEKVMKDTIEVSE